MTSLAGTSESIQRRVLRRRATAPFLFFAGLFLREGVVLYRIRVGSVRAVPSRLPARLRRLFSHSPSRPPARLSVLSVSPSRHSSPVWNPIAASTRPLHASSSSAPLASPISCMILATSCCSPSKRISRPNVAHHHHLHVLAVKIPAEIAKRVHLHRRPVPVRERGSQPHVHHALTPRGVFRIPGKPGEPEVHPAVHPREFALERLRVQVRGGHTHHEIRDRNRSPPARRGSRRRAGRTGEVPRTSITHRRCRPRRARRPRPARRRSSLSRRERRRRLRAGGPRRGTRRRAGTRRGRDPPGPVARIPPRARRVGRGGRRGEWRRRGRLAGEDVVEDDSVEGPW